MTDPAQTPAPRPAPTASACSAASVLAHCLQGDAVGQRRSRHPREYLPCQGRPGAPPALRARRVVLRRGGRVPVRGRGRPDDAPPGRCAAGAARRAPCLGVGGGAGRPDPGRVPAGGTDGGVLPGGDGGRRDAAAGSGSVARPWHGAAGATAGGRVRTARSISSPLAHGAVPCRGKEDLRVTFSDRWRKPYSPVSNCLGVGCAACMIQGGYTPPWATARRRSSSYSFSKQLCEQGLVR